ncbi:extracellular solute-binding protein [Butyrivibrio sp. CB08]|uniref:extracellular solute-binding protein n=1 Tax=Butyrivibrio sp. CB08 TaxID=2364879 RepID=UPI000EAA914C|nr:extracellular solute-binding protein [Butyrivibrio sp. CB08]RKM58842.1 extracellular solute-binding protein [Butyrivibrio sp. CB08]
MSKLGEGKRLIKLVAVLVAEAMALLLSSCGNSERQQEIEYISGKYNVPEEKQLIVYTSHKEEVYLPIIREFENRTGIWVEIHAGGTAEMFSEVRSAAEEGRCDIMFGGGIESYEAGKDLFLPYSVSEKNILDPGFVDNDNYWTAFTELPIVFVYNKKLVSYSEAPKTWKELLSSKWKGQIAFADMNNSGTSYTIISTMEQVLDKDAKEILPRFYDQLGGRVLASSGQVIPKVADGDFLIGITLEETARKAMGQGEDIAMIYPEDGTSAVPDGCAMVKNAPHSYNAGRFIDFIVGYDTQQYAVENFYRRSVRTDLDYPYTGTLDQIDFDVKRSAKEEKDVFALWDQLENKGGQ